MCNDNIGCHEPVSSVSRQAGVMEKETYDCETTESAESAEQKDGKDHPWSNLETVATFDQGIHIHTHTHIHIYTHIYYIHKFIRER